MLRCIPEMSRPSYICTVCLQHFTRKYSGKRHNSNIDSGRSEIVPYIQYMVGRSSGRYLTSHPSWYRKQRQLQANHSYPSENHAIADNIPSNRAVKCSLGCRKALNRAQLDRCSNDGDSFDGTASYLTYI